MSDDSPKDGHSNEQPAPTSREEMGKAVESAREIIVMPTQMVSPPEPADFPGALPDAPQDSAGGDSPTDSTGGGTSDSSGGAD